MKALVIIFFMSLQSVGWASPMTPLQESLAEVQAIAASPLINGFRWIPSLNQLTKVDNSKYLLTLADQTKILVTIKAGYENLPQLPEPTFKVVVLDATEVERP